MSNSSVKALSKIFNGGIGKEDLYKPRRTLGKFYIPRSEDNMPSDKYTGESMYDESLDEYIIHTAYTDRVEDRTVSKFILLDLLKSTTDSLTATLGNLKAASIKEDLFNYNYACAIEILNKSSPATISKFPSKEFVRIEGEKAIMSFMSTNNVAMEMIKNNEKLNDIPIIYVIEHSNDTVFAYKATIDTAVICKRCKSIQLDDNSTHELSIACKDECEKFSMIERGYKIVTEEESEMLIKTKNVSYEYRPCGYVMWAPEWVRLAIDAFRNHDTDFAGMTLDEYLDKMGSTHKKE